MRGRDAPATGVGATGGLPPAGGQAPDPRLRLPLSRPRCGRAARLPRPACPAGMARPVDALAGPVRRAGDVGGTGSSPRDHARARRATVALVRPSDARGLHLNRYILAVDLGTSGVKVALIALDGGWPAGRASRWRCTCCPAAAPNSARTTGGTAWWRRPGGCCAAARPPPARSPPSAAPRRARARCRSTARAGRSWTASSGWTCAARQPCAASSAAP